MTPVCRGPGKKRTRGKPEKALLLIATARRVRQVGSVIFSLFTKVFTMNLTDPAADQLAAILEDDSVEDGKVVRLVAQQGELALGLDDQKPEDITFEKDGKTVLCVDEQVKEALAEKTLDVDEQQNLVIR